MKLNVIVESICHKKDSDLFKVISKNPCEYCFLGKGMMCADRSKCRWKSHEEIYIKGEISEIVEQENVIYAIFCINDRNSDDTLLINFLKEKSIYNKQISSYYDGESECTWYVVAENKIYDVRILLKDDNYLTSEYYYGKL
jgi:hypothetical protein